MRDLLGANKWQWSLPFCSSEPACRVCLHWCCNRKLAFFFSISFFFSLTRHFSKLYYIYCFWNPLVHIYCTDDDHPKYCSFQFETVILTTILSFVKAVPIHSSVLFIMEHLWHSAFFISINHKNVITPHMNWLWRVIEAADGRQILSVPMCTLCLMIHLFVCALSIHSLAGII